jgi:hypothetical protein
LDQIEKVSNRYGTPRDFLVELSVARLAPYVDSLAETHDKRRLLFEELDAYRGQIDELFSKAKNALTEDDAFLVKVENLTNRTRKLVDEISKTVKDQSEFIY